MPSNGLNSKERLGVQIFEDSSEASLVVAQEIIKLVGETGQEGQDDS